MARKPRIDLPRGIRQRGDKYFVDVTVNGTRKTATCATLAEANAKKAELQEALAVGRDVSGSRRANAKNWTLTDALDKTLSLPPKAGWKGASSEKQNTLNIEDAMKYFGPDFSCAEVTLEGVEQWLEDCDRRGNSNATLNRKRSSLSKILSVAVEYGGLEVMPKLPKLRRERVSRMRIITDAEEQLLLKRMELIGKQRVADFVAVLIDTGMRRSELLNVRPQDIDFKTGVIMVYGKDDVGTKNGGIRSVPMTKRVKRILGELTQYPGLKVFGDVDEQQLRHAWDMVRGQMGLADDKDFVLHTCRHTCASRLVKAGVSLLVVQKWLGHTRIETTMRYAHLYPDDLVQAVKALEDA